MNDRILEPITVLYPSGDLELMRIYALDDEGRVWVRSEQSSARFERKFLMHENEGLSWIRGHHTKDAAEVQAMLVALSLSR